MKTKKSVLLFIFLLILTVSAITLFSGTVLAFAYTSNDMQITFKNNSLEFTPTKTENGYSMEYIPDMLISISGSIPSDKSARSDTTITLDGERVSSIYKAGSYEVTVSVYPSDGSSFVFKQFKFEVLKKELQDLRFDPQSINLIYLDELNPKILLDTVVEKSTTTSFVYYTDSTKTTRLETPPKNVGEYWVEGIVSGDNFFGRAESKLTISKSNAEIHNLFTYPEITYSKEDAGENGYDIIELLGATVTNTNTPQKHQLKTFIKVGDEWREQSHLLIPNTYDYKLCFDGEENYAQEAIFGRIVLKKADIEIVANENALTIPYADNLDAFSAVKSFLNKANGFSVKSLTTGLEVSEINENQLSVTFFDLNGNPMDEPPQSVGVYGVNIELVDSLFYNPRESGIITFEIVKRNISDEIIVFAEQKFDYGENYDVESYFSIPSKYSAIPTFELKEIDLDGEIIRALDEKPTLPGRYMAVLHVEDENYFGEKKFIFTILKVQIPESAFIIENLEYVYGDEIGILCEVDIKYHNYPNVITPSFKTMNGEKLDSEPQDVGTYIVSYRFENAIYVGEVEKTLTISKKDLRISAMNRVVTFGNPLFTLDENNAYKSDDFIIVGLVQEADLPSILSSITVYVGDDNHTTNNVSMVVGNYGMKIEGNHPNYNIIDDNSGVLTIAKRTLTVRTSSVKQYVGFPYSPSITVENSVYNDLAENMVYLFEVFYSTEDGLVLNTPPTLAGTYLINARVKADSIDSLQLKNYELNFVGSTLTLLNNQKSDSENQIILEGKFDANIELVVRTMKVSKDFENVIKEVDKKYDIAKLYYIQYTFNTVDDSSFVMKINRAGIDLQNAKIMVGYNAETFEEVPFTIQGDYIVIRLENMASYYAICTPHKLSLVWIIVIVVGVVLLLAGVGVFLWIYFSGATVKARKNEATLSSAVTAADGVKTEDEEFDELLENFDESTVQKHEDPAKRISREKKEAEREQYRLYLRRMRASADKNTLDKLGELGITSDFDEEKAIDQLIERDRKERLRLEEEETRRKAEEEKKKQEETSFTINERRTGTLSGATQPVVPKKKKVDDDIDF